MKKIFLLIVLIVSVLTASTFYFITDKKHHSYNIDSIVEKASQQLQYFSRKNFSKKDRFIFPRTLDSIGNVKFVGKKDWTSGFYPGILWLMYDLTQDNIWKDQAIEYTILLETEKLNASNHDIGFKMMSSFGLAYKYTKDSLYKDVLIQSANTLVTRYNEKVGCIRSWNHHQDKWEFPVIIDNLMNLELLFWASKETGDPVFYNIAVTHAKTTMKNHFRSDYSSYHVVGYNAETGDVISKNTHQGYADESSWARGQAWALYGYTMIYRETKDPIFLKQAENIANYLLNIAKFPEDYVPVWDFDLTDVTSEPRDASAAAIMASAFYELITFTEYNKDAYLEVANNTMNSLSSKAYFSELGSNKGFLLMHSTGSKPHNSEIDIPLVYADYYYLEALSRKINLQK